MRCMDVLPRWETGGPSLSTSSASSPAGCVAHVGSGSSVFSNGRETRRSSAAVLWADVAAVVNAAVTPIKALWSSITGMFSSVAFGGLGAAVSVLAPNLSVEILGGIGVLAALVSAIAHAYAIVNGVSATNNATIVLAENFLNKFEVGLGGKPLVFANDPTMATA